MSELTLEKRYKYFGCRRVEREETILVKAHNPGSVCPGSGRAVR